jgi:hypothetical protein
LVSPVAILNNSIGLTKSTRILSSIYAEYTIIPNLFAKVSINYDDVNQQSKKYVSDYVAVGGAAERITNPGKMPAVRIVVIGSKTLSMRIH